MSRSDEEDPALPASTDASPLLPRTWSMQSVPEEKNVTAGEPPAAAAAAAATTITDNINIKSKVLNNLVRSPATSRPGSRDGSRAPSPTPSIARSDAGGDGDLPTNVSTPEQLKGLPEECLSGDPVRPLQHFDESGVVYKYALNPMTYSVLFVLIVEACERFSFYGINYTQTAYMTGVYDSHWNAGMDAVMASSFGSISVAVAYTTPFLGAFFADKLFGDYRSILVGSLVFYLPGISLIALTTIPGLLGDTFNRYVLLLGLLVLWPMGTGTVKSIVNVFGAKQFHPLIQSSLIEAYYVKFYMMINVGALIGGVAVPLTAQKDVSKAYFLPVISLTIAIVLFLAGTPRFVRSRPSFHLSDWFGKKKKKLSPVYAINNTGEKIPLSAIVRVSLLVVPFNIAYSQMATTFIVQGTVMQKAFGFIDAACMNNADAISVLVFGSLVGNVFYPWCANRGIKIPTTYKFAIGSLLGAAALMWAMMVEMLIHTTYEATGKKVSIMWQAMSYILIGAGEIFAVSAAYEVAYTVAPPEMKVLASAFNLFCIGGLPNVLCLLLYQACEPWFRNSNGTTMISHIDDYSTANVYKFFMVLFLIAVGGAQLNLFPSIREFVASVEERATDMIRTPKTPMRPPRRGPPPADEEEALLKVRRHQYYLKYGSGPSLAKSGSMRAGPAMSRSQRDLSSSERKHMKSAMLSKLYRSDPVLPGIGTVITSSQGKPVTMAGALGARPQMPREQKGLGERSSSS